ncbi:hypothetical protein [Legionella oakridgensis]|uniref:Uncharacterized protein n=2 Tax=Legionella oakridgensis TaxID=29423 RepID=W0BDJ0_9GAMM|nr:hypothetical protein [Legionella oakridgensis]AHE66741.1 hypothetical protein Loa_01186 [Legionella oakridgensis ATCC 33761 = DSM 21215]ETO93605.1 hypothetical protein LOR_57c13320 [Legionella oakridgensis RV-2-2007]KTD38110.1 hypothetical protein Loak_1786 [Legionella oakridgensis]STY19871.1 Uncharacterised protein [Legionella longbeachae]
MGKTIDKILFPKREGLSGTDKPCAVVLSSPYDRVGDPAVRFGGVVDALSEIGYRILNKNQLFFDMISDGDDFIKNFRPIFPKDRKKGITLWLEAHGTPGWLFAGEPSLDAESKAVNEFANFVKRLEKTLNTSVINVVLSCCYSGLEYVNDETGQIFVSPARQLSKLLPDTDVIGFIGVNTSAKITHVYEQRPDGSMHPTILSLQEGAVLFANGLILDAPKKALFFDDVAIPLAIAEASGIIRGGVLPFSFTNDVTHHESDAFEDFKSADDEESGCASRPLGTQGTSSQRHRFFPAKTQERAVSAPIACMEIASVPDIDEASVPALPTA